MGRGRGREKTKLWRKGLPLATHERGGSLKRVHSGNITWQMPQKNANGMPMAPATAFQQPANSPPTAQRRVPRRKSGCTCSNPSAITLNCSPGFLESGLSSCVPGRAGGALLGIMPRLDDAGETHVELSLIASSLLCLPACLFRRLSLRGMRACWRLPTDGRCSWPPKGRPNAHSLPQAADP